MIVLGLKYVISLVVVIMQNAPKTQL